MIKKVLKEIAGDIPENKKRVVVSLAILALVFALNLIGWFNGFKVVLPFTIFSGIFGFGFAFLSNKNIRLLVPTWTKVVASAVVLYTGYFLVGVLVINAPLVDKTATNIYGGKVIATAGVINRSLTGYEYLGRVDYKRIYISEAINQFTGRQVLGETKVTFTAQELIDDFNESESDVVLVFFKNNCPYCAGGFSGVLSAYNNLSDNAKKDVFFVNLETELGQKLAKEYRLEKASTIVRISRNGQIDKIQFATEDMTPNTDAITMIFSDLYV